MSHISDAGGASCKFLQRPFRCLEIAGAFRGRQEIPGTLGAAEGVQGLELKRQFISLNLKY